jgi:FkbM family methyltransferase
VNSKPIKFVQKCLRSRGYEVVPYPPDDWVRQRDALRRILRQLSVDCVFDVGANRGQYGSQLRDIGYKGWILSFEPIRSHFEELSRTAATRRPWKTFQYALGSRDGESEINVNEDGVLSSFLTRRGSQAPNDRVMTKETVQIRRLDSIFKDCMAGIEAKRLYLKLDTQGFDLEAMRGADGVLAQFAGVQTEVSFLAGYDGMPPAAESLAEFRSRGFDVVDFMPVARTSDGFMIEMDCLMARRGR